MSMLVHGSDNFTIDDIELEFYGDKHAAFPTHNAVLSHDGQGFSDATVAEFAEGADIE
jgi:hypothetical protein